MTYTRLGRSGLKISSVLVGAMSYGNPATGEPWILPAEKALPLLHYAYERGINTWDTADVYGQGSSEEIIGQAIREFNIPREHLVLLTKCYFGVDAAITASGRIDAQMSMINDGHMVNRVGLSRKHIFDAVDASVKRLGTYIDVLQIHRLDRDVEPEEIMRALNDVVESGKVRYIGASSMAAWEFQMLNTIAEKHGWHKFISMQNYHNLLYREEEREMHPYCTHAGIGIIPWSPLAQGILARPWSSTAATSSNDSSLRTQHNQYFNLIFNPQDKSIVDKVEEISLRVGKTMAVVAGAWSLRKGVNPILGLGSKERIDEAVEMVRFAGEMGDEVVKELDAVYVPKGVVPVY
ncbi:voltage-gated shaker-like K+ channel, subunit [Paraphoma chrysanthemicola]|uniref:Voltage-gated shaker-like K+ channel, subunit n=1 Tax=Paraphoma chrysanthemicola TaxID=798071 RepID=A0A8K0R762_9PLEO|nr:voltage-gated shaker-like K+ channel, subunit [Paraphoma chrysanthemicola]